MNHVVMFSGGVGSWAAAKRVAERHGTDHLTLLFTDTAGEDTDLYRFLVEGAALVTGCAGSEEVGRLASLASRTPPTRERAARKAHLEQVRMLAAGLLPRLQWLAEGRTIWEVFRDERFLGNHRVDPCAKILKRQMADRWLAEHCDPADTTIYVGIDWTEEHRFTRLAERRRPWRYAAPLCEAPYVTKPDLFDALRREGIRPPRLYDLGFAHNNCGGGCVKAGIGHFAHLLRTLPEVYAEWERNEDRLRAELGPKASILTDRRGGARRPLPLAELRQRIEAGYQPDMFDIGGCGCFVDTTEEAAA